MYGGYNWWLYGFRKQHFVKTVYKKQANGKQPARSGGLLLLVCGVPLAGEKTGTGGRRFRAPQTTRKKCLWLRFAAGAKF